MLGRWKPEGSDTYIRSFAGVMARIQKTFAKTLRLRDRSLLLDEGDIIEGAGGWISERLKEPVAEGGTEGILERLGTSILLPPQFEVQMEEEPGPHETYQGGLQEDPEKAGDGEKPRAAYVVVNVSKRCRRLHKASDGCCWMGRTRIFKSSVEFEEKPDEEHFTHVCRVCWPPQKAQPGDSARASEGDSGSSSSSSQSSSEGES